MNRKTITTIGALLGTTTFLAVGLLPALAYGGYAGLLLASGLGVPLHLSALVGRMALVGGMVLGAVAVGSLFTVLGAVVGTGAAVLVEAQQLHAHPASQDSQARD